MSPITVALPAIKLKKQKNIPVIMNVQDLWPENIIAITGINNSFINFFINKLVNYIYINIDLILVASPAFIDKITFRIKDKNKVIYWPQYSIVSKNGEQDIKIFNNKNFNIVFTGNIGDAQGLEILIDAAKRLKETNIVFHLIGDGRNRQKLEEEVNINNLNDKIIFYGQIPENEIPKYLSNSNVALLILKPNPIFDMTIPAKFQTYLACGCPILGCVHGISKQIIDDNQLGITTEVVNAQALVTTCEMLLKNKEKIELYSQNALLFSKTNFDKEILIEKLIYYMEEIKNESI
ncbi:MAG: glycosyltransferase family 4 protein [Thomasclavelia spiroformis]